MKGRVEFTKDMIESVEQVLASIEGDSSGISRSLKSGFSKKQKTEEEDNEG